MAWVDGRGMDQWVNAHNKYATL